MTGRCGGKTQYSFSAAFLPRLSALTSALAWCATSHCFPSNPAVSHLLTELGRNWAIARCASSASGKSGPTYARHGVHRALTPNRNARLEIHQ